ncbi:uncharacterized protein YtpQ (UPF0354 family) [Alkalihalobacillus xiaoxiensis]|uniref:Uncharacterized protein YtpQ (UPF0354 family) n=1 Tax=Shouchella xiaoxiensis TaxID=766895 RepID=A0ABS2SSE5_9BACI|nr:DUF1444 domain-containing protein [Shouchella xiaoxiensis]MBM7838417.1 uncharacterized protein YtpQ (UPF0354 family) [Shouchella xiaoxiensis]
MELQAFRKKIEKKLERDGWTIRYDHKESTLRVEDPSINKGATLALKPLLAKWERKEYDSVEEVIRHIQKGLESMKLELKLTGNEKAIYPVIRAASFPTESGGKHLIWDEHTAETRIYYAVDLGESYSLIDETLVKESSYTKQELKEMALFNVRSLNQPLKSDTVAGNTFYFLQSKDGYVASRILDQTLIEKMEQQANGELAVSIPHQDALIFADIQNDTGYDVLGQMALQFFGAGRIPVTALPFSVNNGELEPIFILAQKKPKG